MIIWTEAYRPFIMGGDVRRPVKTKVNVKEVVDLGKNIEGSLIETPKGKIIVVENTSGAIVGTSLSAVKKDIELADEKVMSNQIDAAIERYLYAELISSSEFWSLYER